MSVMKLSKIPAGQAARFAIVGGGNTVLDVSLFTALVYGLSVGPILANIISYAIAMVSSYVFNAMWTFKKADALSDAAGFLRFAAFNLMGLFWSSLTIWALLDLAGSLGAKILSIAVTFVWNFATSRLFVFNAKA